jgi:hypothetical protein
MIHKSYSIFVPRRALIFMCELRRVIEEWPSQTPMFACELKRAQAQKTSRSSYVCVCYCSFTFMSLCVDV